MTTENQEANEDCSQNEVWTSVMELETGCLIPIFESPIPFLRDTSKNKPLVGIFTKKFFNGICLPFVLEKIKFMV